MTHGQPAPQPPADVIAIGFQTLVEGLRDDFREDIRELRDELGRSEGRVTEKVLALDAKLEKAGADWHQFTVDHSEEHESETAERRQAHGTFYDFIRKAELDQARRDGALGVTRYVFELLSRHGARIAWIILSIGAAAGVATGSIGIQVGT